MAQDRERCFDGAEARRQIVEGAAAHVTDPEDPTFELSLATGDDRAMLLPEEVPELRIVDAGGILDRRDSVRSEPAVRIQFEAQRMECSSRRLREFVRPGGPVFGAFLAKHSERLS